MLEFVAGSYQLVHRAALSDEVSVDANKASVMWPQVSPKFTLVIGVGFPLITIDIAPDVGLYWYVGAALTLTAPFTCVPSAWKQLPVHTKSPLPAKSLASCVPGNTRT